MFVLLSCNGYFYLFSLCSTFITVRTIENQCKNNQQITNEVGCKDVFSKETLVILVTLKLPNNYPHYAHIFAGILTL